MKQESENWKRRRKIQRRKTWIEKETDKKQETKDARRGGQRERD